MVGTRFSPFFMFVAVLAAAATLAACAERPPQVTREVIGLDASGRPVVSYVECDSYGLAGNLGGCFRETPPVVWCYRTLANNDCFRKPDLLATREPEPIVDKPMLPTLYALPVPAQPPAPEATPDVPPASGDMPPPQE